MWKKENVQTLFLLEAASTSITCFSCLCQIFKNKYKDEFYPYLLPKSQCTADQLSFTVPGSAKAKVQVFQHRTRVNSRYCWQMQVFLSTQCLYVLHLLEKSLLYQHCAHYKFELRRIRTFPHSSCCSVGGIDAWRTVTSCEMNVTTSTEEKSRHCRRSRNS